MLSNFFKIIALLLITQPVFGKTITFNADRSIEILGGIDDSIVPLTAKLFALTAQSKDPIDILINSPGGIIYYGNQFVQAMRAAQARGVTIRCVVGSAAASMAYTIFAACSERYALPFSRLLFHPPWVKINAPLRARDAAQILSDLRAEEKAMQLVLWDAMGIEDKQSRNWFYFHFFAETLFYADQLLAQSPKKWFELVDDVLNCPNLYVMKREGGGGEGRIKGPAVIMN